MKKIKNNIENLIDKVIKETLSEKADSLVKNINELGGMEDSHPKFGKLNLSKMTDDEIEDLLKQPIKNDSEDDSYEMESNEGFDSDEVSRFRSGVDYDEDEFMEIPLGKVDYSRIEDDSVTPKRYSINNLNRYLRDMMDDSEINESKTMCEQCGSGSLNEEETCEQCGWSKNQMDEDIYDIEDLEGEFDYVETEELETDSKVTDLEKLEDYCNEDSELFDVQRCKYNRNALGLSEIKEKLHGKQRKLDRNKNGRIDSEDFKLLRKSKKSETDESWGAVARAVAPMAASYISSKFSENNEEIEEGNAFTGALADAKEKGKTSFEFNGKKYDVKENKEDMNEKWEDDVEIEKTGEYSDMSIEELNSAIKKLKDKNEKTKKSGKKVSDADRTKMSQLYFAKRAKQGWKGKGKSKVKESIKLTENEMIDLIEKIVNEEKNNLKKGTKPKGYNVYEKAHKGSGKENDDYLKSVTKKMKDYLKDGSKGEYSMNPKIFPKGNGELTKMSKKAYVPSEDVQDYVDNFTAAGLENLTYDEINPNEKWVEDNVVGSSRTGNNPEWANSVETGVNKKRNKIRKDNLLGKIKQKAYNKAPQPAVIDKTGEDKGTKILTKLESVEPKEDKNLNEEFDRMKQLLSYNRKTQ